MKAKFTLLVLLTCFGFYHFSYGQCSSGQTTETFSFTGALEQFTVPDGVTEITMNVTGADGGNDGTFNGGSGGTVMATFSVTSGEILDIVVGEAGSSSTSVALGAGGGGGSGVRRNSNSTILLIGGGGGGAGNGIGGGGNTTIGTENMLSLLGMGGNSFNSNGFGGNAFNGNGAGGTCIGCVSGGFGAGAGGAGDSSAAGSGGGGIGGPTGAPINVLFLGVGGGGGSSFIDPIGASQSFIDGIDGNGNSNNGSVTFCFTLPVEEPIPTMSQWGLMIFGLLTMNLGLIFLRKKEELFV